MAPSRPVDRVGSAAVDRAAMEGPARGAGPETGLAVRAGTFLDGGHDRGRPWRMTADDGTQNHQRRPSRHAASPAAAITTWRGAIDARPTGTDVGWNILHRVTMVTVCRLSTRVRYISLKVMI